MAMTIDQIALTHVQIPLKEPFRISGGQVTVKDGILVQVLCGEHGPIGLGECSPMAAGFGYSSDTPEGCWEDLTRHIVPDALGQSFDSVEDILNLASRWQGSRFAVAGVETALWDALGQSRKSSIAELLGVPDGVAARGVESGLAVGLYPNVVELLRTIESHLAEGYKRVKIKIAPGQDVDLVKSVREHFGPIDLMVDANAAYSIADLDVFKQLDEYELMMFEQPFGARDIDGLAQLQAQVETPVCIDESAETLETTIRAIEAGACKIVNIKLQRVGGFGPGLAIHNACAERGVACWIGCMPELGIGQAAGIHMAALPNCRYPTDVEPSARWFVDDYSSPLIDLSAPGILAIPRRPGLGYQVDFNKLSRYQVRREEFHKRDILRDQR